MTANELAKELREIAVTPSFAIRLAAADIVEAHAKLTHELMCELQDPNGTIWEHAKRLQDERDALKAKVEKYERGAMAFRNADLVKELSAMEGQRDLLAAENERLRSEIETLETRHAAVMLHTQGVVGENARLREALQRIADYQGRFGEDDPQSVAQEALTQGQSQTEKPLHPQEPSGS